MSEPTYEQLTFRIDYLAFTLSPKRFRSFRLHLGEEGILNEEGDDVRHFDVVWFRDTEELVAVEVKESLGIILPLGFKLKKNTERYLFLGCFTEREIDKLVIHSGGIIAFLFNRKPGMFIG